MKKISWTDHVRNEEVLLRAVFLNRRAAGPVPGPGISCTGPREVLLEFVILVF